MVADVHVPLGEKDGNLVFLSEKLRDVESRVAATIDEALEFAMNSPDPKPEDAVTDLSA